MVLERRSRDYVEGRVRAGVLDRITVDVMGRLGLDARLRREGLAHAGTTLMFDGETFHIDFQALTRSHVTIYGQSEVMKDVFDAADERGLKIVFEADDVRLHDVETEKPFVTYRKDGAALRDRLRFHRRLRRLPRHQPLGHSQAKLKVFERPYPFGWLGVLAEVPPAITS